MSGYSRMKAMDLGMVEDDEGAEDRLLFGTSTADKRALFLQQQKQRRQLIMLASVVAGLLGIGLVLGLVYGLRPAHSKPADLSGLACPMGFKASDYDQIFFVVGDWGRAANDNQQTVARMMGELGKCYQPSFVISTGDNFYVNGLKMQSDPYFTKTFTNVYTAPALQVPWYAVLGNHDYGELTDEQVATCSSSNVATCPKGCCVSPLWQHTSNISSLDSRWTLTQGAWKLSKMGGKLDIIFADTTPLVAKYRQKSWANVAGGVASQDADAQKAVIKSLLQSSTAPWKIFIGHHPVHSLAEHCNGDPVGGDCADMQFLKPWLQESKVATYMCGHDHDLQAITTSDDPVVYVVSGAGSDVRSGEFDEVKVPAGTDFWGQSEQGFVAVVIKGDVMTLHFWVDTSLTAPIKVINIKRPE